MPSSSWVFRQLDGDRAELRLDGWAKPQGRPRKGAVVEESHEARREITYYPGAGVDAEPTIHVFGTKIADQEINGYLRDADLGTGGALRKKAEIKAFFRRLAGVRAVCEILGYDQNVFVDVVTFGLEGASEISYKIKLLALKDNSAAATARAVVKDAPAVRANRIKAALERAGASVARPELSAFERFRRGLNNLAYHASEAFDIATTTAIGAFSNVLRTAQDIQSLERAAFAQIGALRAAIGQFTSAGLILRETAAAWNRDIDTVRTGSTEDLDLGQSQALMEDALRDALAEAAEMDRDALLAAVLRAKATHEARDGETWESISSTYYGSPERAADIRAANAGAGSLPVPGTVYLIPE